MNYKVTISTIRNVFEILLLNFAEKYPHMVTNYLKVFVRPHHNGIDIVCNIDTEENESTHFADKKDNIVPCLTYVRLFGTIFHLRIQYSIFDVSNIMFVTRAYVSLSFIFLLPSFWIVIPPVSPNISLT